MFGSFFKIGLFTFGGGYAMVPIIQREVIDHRGWVDRDEFVELLTLAQSAPGPIALNTSVFVGYKMRGYAGAKIICKIISMQWQTKIIRLLYRKKQIPIRLHM